MTFNGSVVNGKLSQLLPLLDNQTISVSLPSVATNAAFVAGGVLGFAAVSLGTGYVLKDWSKRVSNIANGVNQSATLNAVSYGMEKAGAGLIQAGKYSALAVTVPAYTAVWIAPKWAVTEGIPQGAVFLKDQVIIPASRRIERGVEALVESTEKLVETTAKTLKVTYDLVLVPYARKAKEKLEEFHEYTLIPLMDQVIDDFEEMAEFVGEVAHDIRTNAKHIHDAILVPNAKKVHAAYVDFRDYTLIPLKDQAVEDFEEMADLACEICQDMKGGAIHVHKTVLVPFGHFLEDTSVSIYHNALVPMANKGVEGLVLTRDYALIPIGEFLGDTGIALGEGTVELGQKVHQYALVPLARNSLKALTFGRDYVVYPLFERAATTGEFLLEKSISGVKILYKEALVPLAGYTMDGVILTKDYIVIPFCKGLVKESIRVGCATGYVAQAIYRHVLVPVGTQGMKGLKFTYQHVLPEVGKGLMFTASVLKSAATVFYHDVAIPTSRVIAEGYRATVEIAAQTANLFSRRAVRFN